MTLWNVVIVVYLLCAVLVYGHLIWMHVHDKRRKSQLIELTPTQAEAIMDAIVLLEYEKEFS